MDKVYIAMIHHLDTELTAEKICYRLGFDNDKSDDWNETLGVLHHLWMNIRKDLGINETTRISPEEVVENLLKELKSTGMPEDNYDELESRFYLDASQRKKENMIISLINVEHAIELFREHLDSLQIEDEEEDDSDNANESDDLHSSIISDTEVVKIQHIRYEINHDQLILNPRWQRTVVWNNKKKQQLIRSLLLGIPLPSLIIYKESEDFGKQYVLDGKQRLTSITEFIAGAWSLPKMTGSDLIKPGNFRLSECGEKVWSDIPEGARKKILNSKLAKITLEGLSNTELYNIFELYNTQGMKLNAAEIRNAAYHDNEIHAMVFDLVGEGAFKSVVNDDKKQKIFQNQMRSIVGGGKDPKRYAAMDIVERYLGYSRAPDPPKQSTTNCIKFYYSNHSLDEDPKEVANEIIDNWNLASELFLDVGEGGAFRAKSGKNLRFHKLKTTTSMILAKLLNSAIQGEVITKEQAVAIVKELDENEVFVLPDKQQTSSIWSHQAQVVCNLLHVMEDYKGCKAYVTHLHSEFITKMKDIHEPMDFF